MRIIKAIFSAFKWGLIPHCDHEAGICIAGQGRKCKFVKDTKVIEKDGVKIQRTNYCIRD